MVMNPFHEAVTYARLPTHRELLAIFIENFVTRVQNYSFVFNDVVNRIDTP